MYGIDNNMRADFFGPQGDTRWNQRRLQRAHSNFHAPRTRHPRPRRRARAASQSCGPTLIVHTAAQPSHDLAASRPFDDFDVNAVGTLNLLEATRQHAPGGACSCTCSTNKVYGDRPNTHRAEGTRDALGLRRSAPTSTASRKTSRSTRASTRSSAPRRSRPTSWCRNTAATSA